jgi:PAS domain S-box-containing protein
MEAAVMELSEYLLETLREDGELILYRGRHPSRIDAGLPPVLVVAPASERPPLGSLRRMEHEYALRAELDPGWAVRPVALAPHQGRTMLVLTDPGGEPLDRLLGRPLEPAPFLRVAIALSSALGHLHGRGLIHKDLKPAHVLVHPATGRAWLMGFGVASRLPRERQAPEPPEFIAGTLAYMAPEQTGRMNRSIDSRSDLYALGVTLYEMLTGSLPFTAADPMAWVHCHIARQPVPPGERLTDVPAPVSAIIVKLLAKTAEERYQTAAGVEADLRIGDLTFGAYCCAHLNTNLLAAGDPLGEVQREAEHGLAFAQKMRFGLVIDITATQLGLVRTLRGLTPKFGSFDDEHFDELRVERRFASNPELARAECWYWIRKMQARFFAGDYAAAVEASLKAQRLLWTSPSLLETAEYCFYGALSRAASCDSATAGQRQQDVAALAAHHRQLQLWAEHCPENFENRAALVAAEIARIEGHDADAMRLYEQAIRSARDNGFVHNEAIAYECASAFYRARGFDQFAELYLRNARYGYLRWDAEGKVRQLDQIYPQLREEQPVAGPKSTIGTPVEHLDLATVIKVSQAVSGEIVLENLIGTLMRTALEHAGAERGLLILPRGDELRIEAEATTNGDTVVVRLREAPVAAAALPEAIVRYVVRTQESVVLDDASAEHPFAADAYLRWHHARSMLCVPLLKQATLIGVLYLENSLARGAFTPARVAVLTLLASEAAVSLENTRLYRELTERDARIRRLVEANIIGIVFWNLEGRIIEANDAFLRMVGYGREDLVSGRVRWRELTPDQWREADDQALAELAATGTCAPREKEYVRQDGSRVPVLVGAALLEGRRDEGLAFVLDLTERQRAEEAWHQAQAELAHITRVMTMGELASSIAHEVNQPLAALVTNANAGLRWLVRDPPDLEEARECLRRIIRDGHRAGEVITRIRSLVKKSAPAKARLDLNDTIQEVLLITDAEARRHRVFVRTELAAALPPVRGDRVQLQQVILNLVMNGIEAMKEVTDRPRELRIRSRPEASSHVLVAVQDRGIGLDEQRLERVFEAFYTTKPEGMGMGLSISRSIIEAHGGRLWPTAHRDYGATFQFTVPTEGESQPV